MTSACSVKNLFPSGLPVSFRGFLAIFLKYVPLKASELVSSPLLLYYSPMVYSIMHPLSRHQVRLHADWGNADLIIIQITLEFVGVFEISLIPALAQILWSLTQRWLHVDWVNAAYSKCRFPSELKTKIESLKSHIFYVGLVGAKNRALEVMHVYCTKHRLKECSELFNRLSPRRSKIFCALANSANRIWIIRTDLMDINKMLIINITDIMNTWTSRKSQASWTAWTSWTSWT